MITRPACARRAAVVVAVVAARARIVIETRGASIACARIAVVGVVV
jgi:hypothetical protein